MIKEIHCFGTSVTAGGGFEFHHDGIALQLKKYYKESPFTQFDYSYPGQLQKLLGEDIRVFNHAKSGYGNERMYRIAYDIIINNDITDKLFIFEFSSVGRKEFWSNTFNKYFIVNYNFEARDLQKPIVSGIAETYHLNEGIYSNKLKNIVIPFMEETFSFEIQNNLFEMNNEFFIDFLKQKNVKFYFIQPPNYSKDLSKHLIVNYYDFFTKNKLRIIDETNEKIEDFHPGLEANKQLAKMIKNKL